MKTALTAPKGNFPSKPELGLALHSWLDGSNGTNRKRAPGAVQQIAATNDLEAVETWIRARGGDNEHTVRSYRREAYRLMAWAVSFLGKPISSMTSDDVMTYDDWLENPTVHPDWKERGWVLFKGPLSPSSRQQAKRILLGLFRWLCECGYLSGNPFAVVRSSKEKKVKRQAQKDSLDRYIEHDLWLWFQSHLDEMEPQQGDELEQLRFERKRFIVTFLYWTALRRFELAKATLGDIALQGDIWILNVAGKGHVDEESPDEVTLLPPAMDALRRYLRARGLPAAPDRNDDDVPLVAALNGSPITGDYINRLLKEIFEAASQDAVKVNPDWKDALERITAHWMRHSFATHSVGIGIPMQAIADQLRHSSLDTTRAIYAKLEQKRRRKELNGLVTYNQRKHDPKS